MYETLETLSLVTMAGANLALAVYWLAPVRRPWGEAPPEEIEDEDHGTDEDAGVWDAWQDIGGEG